VNPTAHRPSARAKGAREAVWPPGALGMARARATVAARACMHARGLAPKCGAPPTHVPSMGPGARGSGRHMGWRWRCGEHLHAGPWGGGGGRAHHSQSREPLGAIPRLTLVGCPTSLSFLTTVTVASSSSNTPVAEIRNDWRAVDWDTRNGRCAVISGHHGVIMGSSWGHHGVIIGSSEIIRVHISAHQRAHLVREQAGVRGGRGPVEDGHAVHVLGSVLEMAQA